MTLKLRIALALAAVAGAIGALATLGSYVTTSHQVRRGVDATLIARAEALRPRLIRPGPVPGRGGRQEAAPCPPLRQLAGASLVQLVDRDGRVTACLDSDTVLPATSAENALLGRPTRYALSTVTAGGTDYRVITFAWSDSQLLQIGRDLEETDAVAHRLAWRLVFLALGGIIVAAIAGWLIARRIVRPIGALRDAAESITRTGDLSTPIPGSSAGEVGSLTRSLTAMVATLAESRGQQQRLVADASHEMRTPLTSLRTNVELLASFDRLPPEDRSATLAAVTVDVEELTNLVSELVELATETGGAGEAAERIPLAELATEVVARARRRSEHSITLRAEGDSAVLVNPRQIERAISNLVDNALKYGGPGPVEVVVSGRRLEVRDRGQGITAADRPHVFERFYRAADSRAAPGSGLGLAIVEQVVVAHGGRVWATERDDGPGAAVGFELPAA